MVSQYVSLSDKLKTLNSIEKMKVGESLEKINHHVPLFRQCSTEWEQSRVIKCRALSSPRIVSVLPTEDIVVGSYDKAMAIYSRDGKLKAKPITSVAFIRKIIVLGRDGFLLAGSYLEYFNNEGKKLKAPFELTDQNNQRITSVNALCIDNKGQWISAQKGTVRFHSKDGSFVSSFSMSSAVRDLVAISTNANIAISCEDQSVQLRDYSGKLARHVSPPPNVSNWEPWHFCCNESDNMLLIANEHLGKPKGVFMYTLLGTYLGQIVHGPFQYLFGLAISHDKSELYVMDCTAHIIYSYKRPSRLTSFV